MSGRLNDSQYLVLNIPGNSHMDDVSGHGLDAEWQSGEAYVEGKNGRSVASFNGTTAYASFTAEQTDSFRFNGSTQDFSVSLWFKKATSAERGTLFDCRDASGDGYWLIVTDTSLHTRINSQDTSIVWANTNWHHVVMSADRDGLLWLYFDGAASDSVDISAQTLATTIGATIGRNSYNSVDYFAGNISDIRIYNMVLTQDEILELYRLGVPQQHVPELPLRQLPEITDSSLVGSWLNRGSQGGDDYSVNGNDGTPTDVVFGGRGGKFNGSTSKIAIPYTNLGSALTYSMWFKKDVARASDDLFSFMKTLIRVITNSIYFYSDWGIGSFRPVFTSGINWHHLVVTQTGTNLVVYVDNVVIGSTDSANAINTTITFNSIGNWGANYFNGNIEDVRIYSEAKSASWVASEYARGIPDSSLVLQTLVNDARDMSGNGNDGTPTDVVFGRGGEFNGTSSNLQVPTTGMLTSMGTIVQWVKTDTIAAGTDYLFGNGSGAVRIYIFRDTQSFKIQLGTDGAVDTGADFTVGQWYQIALTWDGTNYIAYMDGVASKTGTYAGLSAVGATARIGSTVTPDSWWTGNIRNTRIFNEAKSAGWVKQDYLRTRKFY